MKIEQGVQPVWVFDLIYEILGHLVGEALLARADEGDRRGA
jgi:hypothetical protein